MIDIAPCHLCGLVRGLFKTIAERQKAKEQLEIKLRDSTAELAALKEQLQQEIAERRRVEAALHESEQLFQQLAENIDSICWTIDAKTRQIIYVSPQCEKIWGLSRADLCAAPEYFLDAIIHPEDRDRIIAALKAPDPGKYEQEYRILRPDGEMRWIRSRCFPIRDRAGLVYRIAGIDEDISDRKQTEAALRDSEKRLQAIISTLCDSEARLQTIVANLLDGLLIVDRRGRVLFANPAAGKIFGCEPEDLIGVELGWPAIKNDIIELTILRPNKEVGIGEMHVAPTEWEGKSVCIISLRDITERKRAENALCESEAKFRQMAENIANVFWLASPEGNQLLYVSPAYEKIWGRPIAAANGKPQFWIETVYPEDREAVLGAIAKQLQGESTSNEYRILRPDGSIRWIWARGFPIKDEFGKLYRIAGIAEDVSDRKIAEVQIQASLHEKEVLLKEIHHRVKNNMQVISSLLELQAQYLDDPQTIALFRESQSRIRSMALIHEQLYQSLHLDKIDFAKYIKDLTTNLFQFFGNHSNAIELKLNLAESSLNIETAIPCGLIVNELVSNSLKYAFNQGMPGQISIELFRDELMKFHLIVSDNGVGLPKNFNIETAATLGLRLVRMLTRQLKGFLEIDTDGGTRFKLGFYELNYRRRV
ncbi:PAS domain S-box protein [Microseira wollei]|uniref:histidine kinase n=1 Tax=Microseira wollei NIES-4236 TaxID=2530354 RepID=A0AAV3WLR0_9CYAN|nr:PAS domain S-box protein [Microseira wollei]GET42069.1 signal transduction histidine kinase [Microseira wollei NIES-4236]